ncbi:MAG: hypothetical protein FJW35_18055, partial [Acidobacteria bacterium]|nr:hypothetical protein [Acidobacteriota bacterium]
VEGEKDAESLRSLGFVATTSGSASSWKPDFAKHFKGRLVAVCGDNDEAGKRYASSVVKSLLGVAGEVRVVELPLGNKDITDWIEAHDHLDEQDLRARIVGMIDKAKPVKAAPGKVDIEAVYTRIADVSPTPLQWLWRDRFPQGMLSLLVGIEGLGKTFLALDMIARVTSGRAWPDAAGPDDAPAVGNCIFMTSEDHLAFTVRPRLDAAGADVSRVYALEHVRTAGGAAFFDVVAHLPALERMVKEVGDVKLMVVDPLTAFLGVTDQHRNGEVRVALSRFSALAEKYDCTVVGISHLSKDVSKAAIHRTIGSVAFSAAARAVWLVAADRDTDGRRLLVPIKNNLAPMTTSLAFSITDGAVIYEDGQFAYHADEVLAADSDATPASEAVQFLRDLLADGRVQAKEVKRLAKQNGIAERTLTRAKKAVGVVSDKEGIGTVSFWYWRLPDGS